MITKIKKSTSEKYSLWFDSRMCLWATIIIDEQGSFNVQSDNGNFSYSWPKHGRESFKHFLIEIARDPHYLLKKISDETYFDVDTTRVLWKAKIIEYRVENELNKEDAREMWDELMEILGDSYDATSVQMRAYEGPLAKISEPWYDFDVVKDYPHGARHFAEVIMPEFSKILKSEIESEGK